MSLRFLTVLFAFALVLSLLRTFPMSLAADWVLPANRSIGYHSVEGTVWNGRLAGVVLGGQAYGDLTLSVRPAHLLIGTVYTTWRLTGGPLAGSGALARGIGSYHAVKDVRLRARVPDLPTLIPLSGMVRVDLDAVVFDDDGCRRAAGSVWTDALAQSRASLNWTGPPLTGEVTCRDGDLVIPLSGENGADRVAIEARIDPALDLRIQVTVESPDPGLAQYLPGFGFEGDNGRYSLVQRGTLAPDGPREGS